MEMGSKSYTKISSKRIFGRIGTVDEFDIVIAIIDHRRRTAGAIPSILLDVKLLPGKHADIS
jgi:hypothetical protein